MNIEEMIKVMEWLKINAWNVDFYKTKYNELDKIEVAIYNSNELESVRISAYFDKEGNLIPNYDKQIEVKN